MKDDQNKISSPVKEIIKDKLNKLSIKIPENELMEEKIKNLINIKQFQSSLENSFIQKKVEVVNSNSNINTIINQNNSHQNCD